MSAAFDFAENLEALIARAAERAARRALADHTPRVALSVDDAARALGTSAPTVRRLVDAGHLTRVPHVGTRVLIPVAALKAFASSGTEVEAVRDVA